MSRPKLVHRRTTCPTFGHGSRCEVAQDKPDRYPRTTEEAHALYRELDLSRFELSQGLRGPAPRGSR